jgi:hypothetical protein
MGGSSLGAEVLRQSFARLADSPRLHVLDSTHPDQVKSFAEAIDPRRAWVVVASKSGSTVEPNFLLSYFLERFTAELGESAPARFLAISDAGSALDKLARERRFLARARETIGADSRRSRRSVWCRPARDWTCRATWNAPPRRARLSGGRGREEPRHALGLAGFAGAGRDKLTLVLTGTGAGCY